MFGEVSGGLSHRLNGEELTRLQAGEIVDVRYPSLKYNTHRRFCYIQFKTADQAQRATELHGKVLGRNLKLVARISDPSQRKDRMGALNEGREVRIINLDWAVTETELEAVFSKYGKVEKARIPTDVSGKSKGYAFVAFSDKVSHVGSCLTYRWLIVPKEEANAALDMNNTKLKSRIMTVDIAKKAGVKRQSTTIIQASSQSTTSPSPDVQAVNGNNSTAPSPAPSVHEEAKPSSAEIQARTIALLNVPDTVNDARIRAIAEPYGCLVKIVLRPDHQGAILEFKNVADAGKAALGLDGYEIIPGRTLGVGDVGEMFKQKAEQKHDKPGGHTGRKTHGHGMAQSTMHIRRPTQLGGRRGGRGGLPSISRAPARAKDKDGEAAAVNGKSHAQEGEGKNNADFKALFLGEKQNA